TAVTVAIQSRPNVAVASTIKSSTSATVVGLTSGSVRRTNATTAIVTTLPDSTASTRAGNDRADGMLVHCAIPHATRMSVTAFLWTLYVFLSGREVTVGSRYEHGRECLAVLGYTPATSRRRGGRRQRVIGGAAAHIRVLVQRGNLRHGTGRDLDGRAPTRARPPQESRKK